MTTGNNKGRRFANRSIELHDLVHRFESVPHSHHTRTSWAIIQRIRDDGAELWDKGSKQQDRWIESCDTLLQFVVYGLPEKRFKEKKTLSDTLREFYAEFEHSVRRMREMLHGANIDKQQSHRISDFETWIASFYQASTYTITSFYINEKHDETNMKINLKLSQDDNGNPEVHSSTETIYAPMDKPKNKNHRRGMKKL